MRKLLKMKSMKRIHQYAITLGLTLSAMVASAQYVVREAERQYQLYNYSKSSQLYEKAYRSGKKAMAAQRAGESYWRMLDYGNAEKWYALASADANATGQMHLGYGKALMANGKYDEARAAFDKVGDGTLDEALLANLKASCDSAKAWKGMSAQSTVNNVAQANTASSDWAPAVQGQGFVFASDRDPNSATGTSRPFLRFDGKMREPNRDKFLWMGRAYNHLYRYDGNAISPFGLEAGTSYHVGTPSFSTDGKEVFFSTTQFVKLKVGRDSIPTMKVELHSAKMGDDGKWGAVENFPYNKGNEYDVTDPFLRGDTLYFSSDMPGGMGGSDLYRSVRSGGSWGTPENLSWANTKGNERSPAMDGAGNFYFASDGRVGFGGLDIFRAAFKDGVGNAISNLGAPVNTNRDDFAFAVQADKGIVYLTSNREGGAGRDDIYGVDMSALLSQWKMSARAWLAGVVYDQSTRTRLSNATVELRGPDGKTTQVVTGADGSYKFEVQRNSSYTLNGARQGYGSAVDKLTTDTSAIYRRDLYLAAVAIDSGLVLPKIYYNFDKYNIRPDAAKILDGVAKLLARYPDIKVELGSHTDSRGSDAYNLWLSQKRAESAVAYLTAHGVMKDRITARGYGETRLVNRCSNGVRCSVPEHQANRRTEITRAN